MATTHTKPQEILDGYVEDLLALGEPFLQYEYLIEVSAQLPAISEEDRASMTLVDGCQSHVWLSGTTDGEGRFHLRAESDTMIVRGLLKVMVDMYDDMPVTDVVQTDFNLLERANITSLLSSERRSGTKAIRRTIVALASDSAAVNA